MENVIIAPVKIVIVVTQNENLTVFFFSFMLLFSTFIYYPLYSLDSAILKYIIVNKELTV